MALQATFKKKVFTFSFKARTSRGPMKDKTSWFILLRDSEVPGVCGIGECGPLPGLSIDAVPGFEEVLRDVLQQVNGLPVTDVSRLSELVPIDFPSICFGLETAALDFVNGGRRIIFDNNFLRGEPIPINGLIWMGDLDFMMNQINEKISIGFRCVKLKVGGLDFERECHVLEYLRKRYYKLDIEIRLDANGAFKIDEALYKLKELARYNVQSIEQPIKPGLPEMEELCRKSPIPVALDEELIGKHSRRERTKLLQTIKPHYIILKPTLLGGLASCDEWISIAGENNIGWWVTSALESGIGLNAICQFTAKYPVTIPQGLGTGGIYEDNFESPLQVKDGLIFHNPERAWMIDELTSG